MTLLNQRSEIEEEETYMINKLVYEGGNQMISYLLNQAIPNGMLAGNLSRSWETNRISLSCG